MLEEAKDKLEKKLKEQDWANKKNIKSWKDNIANLEVKKTQLNKLLKERQQENRI